MRTILFDIDGTLLVTNSGGSTALRQAMRDCFDLTDPSIDIQFGGRTDRSILGELLRLNGLPDTSENRECLRHRYVDLFPDVLRRQGGMLLPGVMPLMEQLSAGAAARCYVMTGNLEQTGRNKLEHFGLGGFFRGVFGGDHDDHRDNLAKRTAQAILHRYGHEETRDLIVVGDTVADIRCGHAIGAKVIAVCTGCQSRSELEAESPFAVHDDLSETQLMLGLLIG